jgi:hypothetical protein
MKCSVMYSKNGEIYEVKIDNPFAEPIRVNATVFRDFLRKHGRDVDGETPLSGMIHVGKNEITFIQ